MQFFLLFILVAHSVGLRQDQEHEAHDSAKRSTLCCVAAFADYPTSDSAFQKDASFMLGNATATGAYGIGDDFVLEHFAKHCHDALQLEKCPHVSTFTFLAGVHTPKSHTISLIDEFLKKYKFHSEEYGMFQRQPGCPPALKMQKDTKRCSKDLSHFMKLLELWKEILQDVKDVKRNSGVKGFFFGSKEKKQAAKKDLAHVKEELQALWSS